MDWHAESTPLIIKKSYMYVISLSTCTQLTETSHQSQALLIIRSASTNENRHPAFDQLVFEFLESSYNSLKIKKSIRKFERGDVVVVALNVDATLVKLAMPPPMMRTLPSGCDSRVIRLRIVFAYSNVCDSLGAPEYSP